MIIRSDLSFMDLDLNRLTNSQHFLQAMAIKMDDFGTMLRHLREVSLKFFYYLKFNAAMLFWSL